MTTITATTHPPLPDIDYLTLAAVTGLSANYMWRIFRGDRKPSLETGKQLAMALGMTLDELYDCLAPRWALWGVDTHWANQDN